MQKIVSILLVALIATIGTASAYNAGIYNAEGTAAAENPIVIKPGQTITLSFYGDSFDQRVLGTAIPYKVGVYAMNSDAKVSDMTVTVPASFTPTSSPYVDVGAIQVTLDENASESGEWQVVVTGGTAGVTLDVGSASRNFMVPEFPTVALPVAAILGLAFVFMRKQE